ncbi:MAG: TAXI family TRAP transporter solute-binding subunit [Oscillospiraceae bacterium]|nr:TAXI family TRAP transporter solute-binding subunit [Oscillospiraceae bacterium]
MKKILALVLAMVMVLALVACGGSSDNSGASAPSGTSSGSSEAPATTGGGNLTFTTGGESGTYYGFGTVLAGKVSDKTSTSVTAITSGGSKANIEALEAGDAQLGFVQSDVAAYGYNGERLFDEKVDIFSTVASLYMEQVQIVTLDPSIKSVADLAGKNVSIGAAGSGVYFNAVDVLGAYGIDADTGINPTYQSFGDSVEALQDGKIDAAFIVAGAPTTAVTSLAASKQVYLVSLDDEHIDKLIAESPYYSKNVISKDAYGLAEDVTTVAVAAVVIARNDVAEDDVYNFISTIYDNIDEITAAHAKGAELDLNFAASYGSVPYHPGAAKYFAEKGITVN